MSETTSSKSNAKTITFVSITLFLLVAYFFLKFYANKTYTETTQESSIEKWNTVEDQAQQLNLSTNLPEYLESISGQSPAFFDDFPWIHKLLTSTDQQEFPYLLLDDLKEIHLPDPELSAKENLAILRSGLTVPLDEDAEASYVYSQVLSAIDPANVDLDNFKESIEQAQSLGSLYKKEHTSEFPEKPVVRLSKLLILRNLCNLHTGSADISDIQAVQKLDRLIEKYGLGLTSLSVALANELQCIEAISYYINSPNAEPHQILTLSNSIHKIDFIGQLPHVLQSEYILQIDFLDAIIDGQPHPLLSMQDPLRSLPPSQIVLAKAQLTAFVLRLIQDDKHALHPDTLLQQVHSPETKAYSALTKKLIQVLNTALQSHMRRAIKTDLRITSTKLGILSRAYQLEHGVFPYSLSDLIPDFIDQEPVLPYSKRHYTYVPSATGKVTPTIRGNVPLKSSKGIAISWPRP